MKSVLAWLFSNLNDVLQVVFEFLFKRTYISHTFKPNPYNKKCHEIEQNIGDNDIF